MHTIFDKMLHYVQGTVEFSASDGFFGVFTAKCRKFGVPLRNVSVKDGVLTGETELRALKSLDEVAEEAGVTLEITEKRGLPILFMKYRRRYGVAAGLALALVMMLFFSSVLWSVEINGVDKTEIELIKATLGECGISVGLPVGRIEKKEAEDKLEVLSPYIQRASVNIIGNRAFVEIYEREAAENAEVGFLYSDIVSKSDGEIIKANIFQGQSELQTGQSVAKGELLVTGEVKMKEDKIRYTDSKAEIIAKTKHNVSVSSAKKLFADVITERREYYSLVFFGFNVPVTQGAENGFREQNMYFLKTDTSVLPVGIERQTAFCTEKRDVILSDEAAYLMCASDFAELLHDGFSDKRITDIEFGVKNGADITFDAVISCEEDICEKVIYGEQTESSNSEGTN